MKGLEGTTTIIPDLRVDFPNGAIDSLGFGFAISSGSDSPDLTVTFQIFDSFDNQLAETTSLAAFTEPVPPTPSGFPEALVNLNFFGTASYATLNFDDGAASRYIIDNFTGTFGSTEDVTPAGPVVPVPTMSGYGLALLILGMFMLAGRRFLSLNRNAAAKN